MIQYIEIIFIYLVGGITFIPLVLFIVYFSLSSSTINTVKEQEKDVNKNRTQLEKKGWIRLTKRYKPKGSSESNVAVLMSGIQSYVQGAKRQKEHVYAILKCGALFVYESDQPNEECKIIIPVHNYNISIYPEKSQDHDIFGRSIALKLTPKLNKEESNMEVLLKSTDATSPYLTSKNELFITCARPVDKEDWYFGLLAATDMMSESPSHVEMMDITHFDDFAMQTLISTVQQDAEYREVQWLNAIIGRLFLSMYKTDEMRQYFQEKITKKTQKIKLPSFLGEISIQSVDIGDSIPYVTQPKLLSLTPEGDLMAEATVNYAGGLRVVIQTDFNWTYSSLMKPIRVPLILSVTLKKLSGKFLLKVKPPPTNRFWIGFYEVPDMEWTITPIVSDKQIRLSMVTNAIQSKIREFMVENMVLPNMDDFPFCPSNGKGGIFGERVPKPSSPKHSVSSPNLSTTANNSTAAALNLDMLGNKVNLNKMPPKVIVTSHQNKNSSFVDSSPKPLRAETVYAFDTSSLVDKLTNNRRSKSISPSSDIQHLSASSNYRARGYSNPDLVLRATTTAHQNDSSEEKEQEKNASLSTTVEETVVTTPSFTRRFSYNLTGFRKRHQQLEALTEDSTTQIVEELETYFPLDKTNSKREDIPTIIATNDNDTITTTTVATEAAKEIGVVIEEKEDSLYNAAAIVNSSIEDDGRSVKSNKSSVNSSKVTLLSKITSSSISSKITSTTSNIKMGNKKNALYNMAGNIFNKKVGAVNKVTKEMKDERNRELQESHNRKMMSLFINPPSEMQQKQQSSLPPPLPPRPTNTTTTTASSLSSISSDEEEALLPIEVVNTFKEKEEVIIVNHHQEHGLSI